jgi:hypothetical protein
MDLGYRADRDICQCEALKHYLEKVRAINLTAFDAISEHK